MRTCDTCDESKPDGEFRKLGRGRKKICIPCEGGGEVKPKQKPVAPEASPPDAGLVRGPALSIAPGLGVEAWIENGCLQLAQGEDVVALSQTEAKVVFAQFAEWVQA